MSTVKKEQPEVFKMFRFFILEQHARKTAVTILAGGFLVLVGQLSAFLSLADAIEKKHLDEFSTRSPAHAAAFTEYKNCAKFGPEITKEECVSRASFGQLEIELGKITKSLPTEYLYGVPIPLRWFL